MIPIGKAIQQEREKRKMSRPQFAAHVGCIRQYIFKIETGYSYPSLPILERLAKAIGITTSELIREAEAIEEESRKRRVKMISEVAA